MSAEVVAMSTDDVADLDVETFDVAAEDFGLRSARREIAPASGHAVAEICRARRYDYTDPIHGQVVVFRTWCVCGDGMVHGILASQPLYGLSREEIVRLHAEDAIAEHAWRAQSGKRARWPVMESRQWIAPTSPVRARQVIANGARATVPVWLIVPR